LRQTFVGQGTWNSHSRRDVIALATLYFQANAGIHVILREKGGRSDLIACGWAVVDKLRSWYGVDWGRGFMRILLDPKHGEQFGMGAKEWKENPDEEVVRRLRHRTLVPLSSAIGHWSRAVADCPGSLQKVRTCG
jgi:hypothetical protein